MSEAGVKVVMIITGLKAGGAEGMLVRLLEILRADFDLHVISLTTMGDLGPRIQALGVPVENLGMRTGAGLPMQAGRLVSRLRAIRPAIVHTWMYHANLIGGIAARLARVPTLIWSLRQSDLHPGLSKRSTRLVMKLGGVLDPLADRVLSCGESVSAVHVRSGYSSRRMQIIPNGFDTGRFRPDPEAAVSVRRELRIPASAPLAGLFARFDPQKNHLGFLDAAARLRAMVPDVHFVLAGAGVDESNRPLLAAAEQQGIAGAIRLLGVRDDVPRLMAALDVLVVPSAFGEGFPNVLGEAMACGVPCVATDVGESASILAGLGRVVPVGDMTALADAARELLVLPMDDKTNLAVRLRQRIVDHYEIGRVAARYEAVYRELVQQAHA